MPRSFSRTCGDRASTRSRETVNSLVETLAINVPGIQRVNILVEGKTRDTLAGHADLTETFDVMTVVQAGNQ